MAVFVHQKAYHFLISCYEIIWVHSREGHLHGQLKFAYNTTICSYF